MLYLYDPRYNLKTKTTLEEVRSFAGKSKKNFDVNEQIGQLIRPVRCYLIDETITKKQMRAWYEAVEYPDENWRTLRENNAYRISNYGRIKTGDRFIIPNSDSRKRQIVWFEGKKHSLSALVANNFIGDRPPGMLVYHKNGLRHDDAAANLMYLSPSEVGKRVGAKSRSRPVIQYDPRTAKILAEYRNARQAAREVHLQSNAIVRNCNGQTLSSRAGHFMYADDYLAKYGKSGGKQYAG